MFSKVHSHSKSLKWDIKMLNSKGCLLLPIRPADSISHKLNTKSDLFYNKCLFFKEKKTVFCSLT